MANMLYYGLEIFKNGSPCKFLLLNMPMSTRPLDIVGEAINKGYNSVQLKKLIDFLPTGQYLCCKDFNIYFGCQSHKCSFNAFHEIQSSNDRSEIDILKCWRYISMKMK